MRKMYYLEGTEWIKVLGDANYEWKTGNKLGSGTDIVERIIKKGNQDKITASVISIDHQYKTVGVFPAEIYAPDSPTADAEKLERILNQCSDYEELKYIVMENQRKELQHDQEI